MDRNFVIPIAVAAGVHSLLFISGQNTPPPPPVEQDVAKIIWKEIDLPPLEPDVLENREAGEHVTEAPPPPISIGLPDPTFRTDDIVVEYRFDDLLPRPEGPVSDKIFSNWRSAIPSTGPAGGPISAIHLDNPPATRFQPAPNYPRELRTLGSDGTATVTFSVDVHGNVFDAAVTRATHSSFGEEALRAVRRWRFEPGLKNGKRVPFRMVQTFAFTLAD